MHNIEKNLALVKQQIAHMATRYNRNPENIVLLAVSKTKPVSDIAAAYDCGQRHFGENYLQEAEKKIAELKHKNIIWHYIGPIQSNKTRKISELFDWVHSVDRLKIARRLNQDHPENKPPLNVLLQVNVDNEPTKSGISLNEINGLAAEFESFPRLKLRGLMAIPAIHTDPEQQHKPFAKMREALLELQQLHPECDTLSMGMSGDMQAAIAEGSTLVRIGTAIFGARTPTNQVNK